MNNNNKLIVIDGIIGAGKTSLIEHLKNIIVRDNVLFISEPVDKFMEYKQFNPLKLSYENIKNKAITQLHITNCLITHFKNVIEANKNKIIICERGLFSPRIFTNVSYELKHITEFEHCFIIDYLNEKIKNNLIDLQVVGLFFIDIPIDNALKRI